MLDFFLNPWVWVLMVTMLIIGAMLFPILGVIVPFILIWVQRRLGFPRNVKTGSESMGGQEAQVSRRFRWDEEKQCYTGRVRLGAETWNAESTDLKVEALLVGDYVWIIKSDVLVLEVKSRDQQT